jgi:hypothetical protein
VIFFGLSEAQRFARDTVREFARRGRRERARRCDEESLVLEEEALAGEGVFLDGERGPGSRSALELS